MQLHRTPPEADSRTLPSSFAHHPACTDWTWRPSSATRCPVCSPKPDFSDSGSMLPDPPSTSLDRNLMSRSGLSLTHSDSHLTARSAAGSSIPDLLLRLQPRLCSRPGPLSAPLPANREVQRFEPVSSLTCVALKLNFQPPLPFRVLSSPSGS
jgi:hypothetical protein